MESMSAHSSEQAKRLIVVGPLPPPIGGGTASVRLFLDEVDRYGNINTTIVNTSPRKWLKDKTIVTAEKFNRSIRIILHYVKAAKGANAIIMFATHSFLFTIGVFLLAVAKCYRVPFYIKPLGAEIGKSYASQKKLVRRGMLEILKRATGVMFQTEELQRIFLTYGLGNAFYIPGYRSESTLQRRLEQRPLAFRIVFISQILREKGAFLLLDALKRLAGHPTALKIECDFYGPIYEQDRKRFLTSVQTTPGSKYCGIIDSSEVSYIMSGYEALVFPTCNRTEGHPGVIIEAMQAGIPVISSRFDSAPELITDGLNGLLVPLGDSGSLADAIKRLATDQPLRSSMAKANKVAGKRFRSEFIVADMMDLMLSTRADVKNHPHLKA